MPDLDAFKRFFAGFDPPARQAIDLEAIRQQWLALQPPYGVDGWILPLPVWGQREYDHKPKQAWQTLASDLEQADPARPVCIYIHIPFCTSKCDFCDSYSFKLGANREKHVRQYLAGLVSELERWSQLGNLSQRPVSTVHLGGGTPTFLTPQELEQLVQVCRRYFSISEQTEWALEASVASLTPNMIAALHTMGFRRLHIGVQSLQDPVRRVIGRRCPADQVLATIAATLAREWVVSVDMICGLPGQTGPGLLVDLQALTAAGVNGVSLYELLIYNQNRRWAAQHGLVERSHLPNYFMFQAGAAWLESQGLRKNLFNHWADQRDDNIYFTFPLRGEDCLAVGALADGVFGDFHYRHQGYAGYLRAAQQGQVGIEGGLRRTQFESLLHPINTLLLSGHLPALVLEPLASSCGALFERWQALELVRLSAQGDLHLTTSGSWFAGNLVKELGEHFRRLNTAGQSA